MSAVLLEARNIQKTFLKEGRSIEVLKGISLDIHAGEMLSIVGQSGAGKSTLLHILGTLELPTSGSTFFGPHRQELFKLNDTDLSSFRNRSLGFVFQFHHLLPEFTALENVMLPALIAGHSTRLAQKQAEEFLEFVGLTQRLQHRPSELSGGEQQRVAIARSVVLKPQLILADEPTGNLDSENSEKVVELLVELNKSMGVTVVLVTHQKEIASRMHRSIEVAGGQITADYLFDTHRPPA